MKSRWYLVQVDIESTLKTNPICKKMVNNILCSLFIIQTKNIKVMNSVYGISIGTVTEITSKQEK